MIDHAFELIAGAYFFTCGAYVFGWVIYTRLMDVRKIVTNHHEHDLADIRTRLSRLEER